MKTRTNFQKVSGYLVLAVLALLILSGCAEAVNVSDCLTEEPYGFLNGLWHGAIAPFTFVIGLFNDSVAVYAVNNNGAWYDFGFVVGACILFGGGGKASCTKK